MLNIFMLFEGRKDLLIGLSLSVLYITYYLVEVVKRPLLVCGAGEFRSLLASLPLLQARYWPTPWCVEARLQTVLGSVLRSRLLPAVRYRRQLLALADGGTVALDWLEDAAAAPAPVLLLLPGLTGGAQADYARCLALAARRLGARCVVFNQRGLGGLPLTSPRLYCAVSHADLAEVVRAVRAAAPGAPLLAVGVSLGGLILGHYLAEQGERADIAAALIVSSPLDVVQVEQCGCTPGRVGVHRELAAERAAVVPHGVQPAAHGGAARAGRGRGRAALPLRARVRRRLHGAALRVQVGGRVLRGGVAARQAGRRGRAHAVPAGRRRPLPAAARPAAVGGGGVAARGAGGAGARRAHRVPGGLVAARRAVHRAPRPPVLRRAAAAPRPAARAPRPRRAPRRPRPRPRGNTRALAARIPQELCSASKCLR